MPVNFRLKLLREEAKMTQKQIGDLINVGDSAISKYERMEQEPEYEALIKLADFFDVTLDYLLGRTNERKAPDIKLLAAHKTDGYDDQLTNEELAMISTLINTYRKTKK